jgi:hypothetical protein
MEIDDFLRTWKSYENLAKVGGFEALLKRWEVGVSRIPGDERFTWDDFSYFIGKRKQILDVELNCRIDEATQERILNADTIFRNKTVEVPYGFSSEEVRENPQLYWFYYRAPPERISDWKIYFELPV